MPTLSKKVVVSDLGTIAEQDVKELLVPAEEAGENRPFIEGDHFQEGDAWVGPGPKASDAGYSDFLEILEPAFVSKNVIDECVDRLSSAIMGWEPRWAWVPRRHDISANPVTDAETATIQELESALTDWWDQRQVHRLLRKLLYNMEWARNACWRLYVPKGVRPAGRLRAATIEEALRLVYLDTPEPEDATVWIHPDTKERLGIVKYLDGEGKEHYELSYLDLAKMTIVRILPENSASTPVDLGGHITIYQISGEPIITEQVRSLQKSLNMTLTLLQKGLVDNHFLERIFENALPPGKWEYEDDGKTRKAYVPAKRGTGGRTDTYLQGIDYPDKDGNTVLATPGVTIRNPLDPTGTIAGCNFWYQAMLEETRQDHILINQLATPSGRGREQARGDFIDSTKDPQLQAELAGRELLLTVVAMAEAFMGSPGKWTKTFKPIFKCRPNYGPLSVAERTQVMNEAKEGFLSYPTAISINGTDDVDGEMAQIEASPDNQLALSERRAEVADKWVLVFPREVALHLAGFSDDEIKEIMKRVTASSASLDPNDPDGPPAPRPDPNKTTPPGPKAAKKPNAQPQAGNPGGN